MRNIRETELVEYAFQTVRALGIKDGPVHGEYMPDECSGYGNDISPDIRVEDIPDGTQSLAIILDDLDHPVVPEFNHWVAWNIPCSGVIPGAALPLKGSS